jgi:hypothetical protein
VFRGLCEVLSSLCMYHHLLMENIHELINIDDLLLDFNCLFNACFYSCWPITTKAKTFFEFLLT